MNNINRFLLLGIIAVVLFMQCGCTYGSNFKSDYNKGYKAYNEQDYDMAVIYFNNALTANSDSYSTYCLLGTSYAYTGDTKSAETILKEAIKLFPDEWNAYMLLGDVKRQEHNYSIAIEYYKKAISMLSMPEEGKVYYEEMINDVIKEQNMWNAKNSFTKEDRLAAMLEEKRNIAISQVVDKENVVKKEEAVETKKEDFVKNKKVDKKSDLVNLDWNKWENAYSVENNSMTLTEYGLKGEDVKNYKWTQLITIQYFVKDAVKQYTATSYFDAHIKTIQDMAKNVQKNFNKQILSETPTEIIYQWTFNNGAESEIAKIVQTDNGIYHYHYAKKGVISNEEKANWLEILKYTRVYQ